MRLNASNIFILCPLYSSWNRLLMYLCMFPVSVFAFLPYPETLSAGDCFEMIPWHNTVNVCIYAVFCMLCAGLQVHVCLLLQNDLMHLFIPLHHDMLYAFATFIRDYDVARVMILFTCECFKCI